MYQWDNHPSMNSKAKMVTAVVAEMEEENERLNSDNASLRETIRELRTELTRLKSALKDLVGEDEG